jgi:succinate dehydrogenase / fumarate reductase flavoprotein subunit
LVWVGSTQEGAKPTIGYRPVHEHTLTNEISYIEPKARVY